jgi:hypothetical protein
MKRQQKTKNDHRDSTTFADLVEKYKARNKEKGKKVFQRSN